VLPLLHHHEGGHGRQREVRHPGGLLQRVHEGLLLHVLLRAPDPERGHDQGEAALRVHGRRRRRRLARRPGDGALSPRQARAAAQGGRG